MATYQDGHIWQKTLNAYPKRPNQHDWRGEKQEINGCVCWMTLPEVHLIVHKTSCLDYCKCKQIEYNRSIMHVLIFYGRRSVHFRWDYVTTASCYIAGYLNKAIWNLRNLCKAIFCATRICAKILCMFLKYAN